MATVPMPREENSSSSTIDAVVQAAFQSSPMMALRKLMVQRLDDRLLISGRVSSFYQKQQAQELVRSKAPGVVVINEVEVSTIHSV